MHPPIDGINGSLVGYSRIILKDGIDQLRYLRYILITTTHT